MTSELVELLESIKGKLSGEIQVEEDIHYLLDLTEADLKTDPKSAKWLVGAAILAMVRYADTRDFVKGAWRPFEKIKAQLRDPVQKLRSAAEEINPRFAREPGHKIKGGIQTILKGQYDKLRKLMMKPNGFTTLIKLADSKLKAGGMNMSLGPALKAA